MEARRWRRIMEPVYALNRWASAYMNGQGRKPQELLKHGNRQGPAPVHLWNPPFCGDMDLLIASDGTWYHEGSPIGRQALVRLFASILKREGDEYFLVTPVEKLRIRVEDCPFVAIRLDVKGEAATPELVFETNTGETVVADREHRLVVDTGADGSPHPRLHVRSNLWALVHRNVFYRLVDIAEPRTGADGVELVVRSKGESFSLGALNGSA